MERSLMRGPAACVRKLGSARSSGERQAEGIMKFARGETYVTGFVALTLAACSSPPTGNAPIRGPSAVKPVMMAPQVAAGAGADFDSDNPFGPAKITPTNVGPV